MEENIVFKKKMIQGISIFLGVVLVFTVLAKTIYTFLLPQVTVEKINSGMIENKILAEGRIGQDSQIIKSQMVDVKAPIEGVISECFVEENQAVKQGEALFVIKIEKTERDKVSEQIQIDEIAINQSSIEREKNEYIEKQEEVTKMLTDKKAALQKTDKSYEIVQIEMQIQDKEAEVKVNEDLYKEELIANQDYEKSREDLLLLRKQQEGLEKVEEEKKKSELQSLEENLRNIQSQLALLDEKMALEENKLAAKQSDRSEMTIISPIDGMIYEMNVAVGVTVLVYDKLAVVVPKDIPITLSFEVAERNLAHVEVGGTISWTLNASKNTATIMKKNMNEVSGNVIVTCEIDADLVGDLISDCKTYRSVDVEMIHTSEPYALLVSNSALVREGTETYVYTIEEIESMFETTYRVHQNKVSIIKEGNFTSAITGSLQEKVQIIKTTSKPLSDGIEVAKS